jgi:hypothetical protein
VSARGRDVGRENLAVVHRLHEALRGGDPDKYLPFYADDVAWHVPGQGGLSGVYRGHAGILDLFERLRAFAPSPFEITHLSMAADESTVFALHNTRAGRAGNKNLDGLEILMLRLREGKIAEVRSFIYDVYANDAFWS